jgi:hypothetical protein
LINRSREWANRCVDEAKLWSRNVFVTLTYDDDHLPADGKVNREHIRQFIHNLRRRKEFRGTTIRFFGCGEYGSQNLRPHYHLILFNCDFPDKYIWKKNRRSQALYRSHICESLWAKGFCSIGEVNFTTAQYTARYCLKKRSSPMDYEKYKPILFCSVRPAIGSKFFEEHQEEIVQHGFIVYKTFEGEYRRSPIPRYYRNSVRNQYEVQKKCLDWQDLSCSDRLSALKFWNGHVSGLFDHDATLSWDEDQLSIADEFFDCVSKKMHRDAF